MKKISVKLEYESVRDILTALLSHKMLYRSEICLTPDGININK